MKVAIHWFRRDLRVADNTALVQACNQAERVVPVFILEDALRTGVDVGAARLAFLLRSLSVLSGKLKDLGYRLVVRRGRSEIEIPKLCSELGAEAVFCNRRYEPYAQERDARVMQALQKQGIALQSFKDAVVWEDRELLNKSGSPYTVFTPYAKPWRVRNFQLPRGQLKVADPNAPTIPSVEIPLDPAQFGHPLKHEVIPAGEDAAMRNLELFLDRKLATYDSDRNIPAVDGTSKLSPHLRCGTIGIRTILTRVAAAGKNASPGARKSVTTFENELIWREFYLQILSNFPHVMRGAFRPEYDRLQWQYDEQAFEKWRSGMTGYPIVDAAMRCLQTTGWMHNRLRMIVAMFLTKDLLFNWQLGERYFMKELVDGDMAANNGGWQWSAGTGTDAAPYFRIFNPITQAKKCDADGIFVRQWIPELRSVSDENIHEPWNERLLAKGYPDRIVIHEQQRSKCLAMYKAVLSR